MLQEKDDKLGGSLKKATKLIYSAVHPRNNKQNVNLAFAKFHEASTAAIMSYIPERFDAADFLLLIHQPFVIYNPKTQFNSSNQLGNAAILGDNRPEYTVLEIQFQSVKYTSVTRINKHFEQMKKREKKVTLHGTSASNGKWSFYPVSFFS